MRACVRSCCPAARSALLLHCVQLHNDPRVSCSLAAAAATAAVVSGALFFATSASAAIIIIAAPSSRNAWPVGLGRTHARVPARGRSSVVDAATA